MDIILRKELNGHTNSVNAVDFDENYIVSGNADHTIKVYMGGGGDRGRREQRWGEGGEGREGEELVLS